MTRRLITIETACNVGSGAIISWLVCWLCLPWWGYEPRAGSAAEITLLFFVVSFARSWLWRWGFDRWQRRGTAAADYSWEPYRVSLEEAMRERIAKTMRERGEFQ
ncbi:MAG: hypothetical protein AAF581_11140 [Planctomycetota bacterium]